jgi:tRNA U34 5-methylaminomethyl-2-thiouridine-forming methyltransferase MnmC
MMSYMAFIRKRGESYYLVHNVRKDGRVRQIHLACLGHRPRISDDIVRGVASKHPFVRIDWKELREKTSRNVLQPFERDSQYLRELLLSIRNLHFDLADLPLPLLELTKDRELSAQVIAGLKLLRGTLDVKLHGLRKVKTPAFDA